MGVLHVVLSQDSTIAIGCALYAVLQHLGPTLIKLETNQ